MDNKWYCEWYSHYGNGIYWSNMVMSQDPWDPHARLQNTYAQHKPHFHCSSEEWRVFVGSCPSCAGWAVLWTVRKGLSFDYFYHSNLSIATHLPRYLSTSSTKLPWKQWLEVVAKGELRITGRRIHCRYVEWPQYYRIRHLLGWNSHCHCLCKWL